jgi:formylglycine-generating enzyme required for sulfatase activity
LHAGDANFDATYAADFDQMGVDEVGSFPGDVSPFGVVDLGGNLSEWVQAYTVRGGLWVDSSLHVRSAFRLVNRGARNPYLGMRVCAAAPRVP